MLGVAACGAVLAVVTACGDRDDTPPKASFRLPEAGHAVSSIDPVYWSRGRDTNLSDGNGSVMCYVDLINGATITPGGARVTLHKGAVFSISGWVVSGTPASEREPVTVELSSADRSSVYDLAARRTARADVSSNAHFRSLNLREPGFTASAPTHTMQPGSYQIRIIIRGQDADIACPIGRAWQVTLTD
jgi:hypothetical protein